jgi:hypothetical protein
MHATSYCLEDDKSENVIIGRTIDHRGHAQRGERADTSSSSGKQEGKGSDVVIGRLAHPASRDVRHGGRVQDRGAQAAGKVCRFHPVILLQPTFSVADAPR